MTIFACRSDGVYFEARRKPTDDNLHAWRRRSKDFLYNLEWIGGPSRLREACQRLTEFLGDDHDLAFFTQHYAAPAELEEHRALFHRLEKKRARLQKKSFELGATIFRDAPRKVVERILK